MRVLICGEGDHDVGCSQWNAKIKEHVFLEGWMQPILRAISSIELELIPVRHSQLVVLPRDAAKHKPLPAGHGAKAFAASFRAKTMNVSLVVFMADADSTDARTHREKTGSIQDGFDHSPYDAKGVSCVPMGTSESWLLTDQNAWISCSGISSSIDERRAETFWGDRHDPKANHPKHVFARACVSFRLTDNRDTRNELAKAIDLAKIRNNCPASYASFETAFLAAL